ncbi:hypothetical protein OKC48_07230 [Methylorubrum extorquens]|uniref:hypothetical protein n=1 Tax=Methylorubrum extorquens TaxID=408 RepID=UPI002236F1BB|nr:hypothetical protein [Methylorubrum extorquens]UYW28299.1 hypothetical protein OKC48_07230 [Methylorubrum extorquens]
MKARRQSFASIDRDVYMTPEPEAVARLVDQYGAEAAEERWHWIDARSLGNLARAGRARLGMRSLNPGRTRSSDAAQEAAAVEVAFLVGSQRAGERAAGMNLNGLLGVLNERGITDMPKLRGAARAENSRDGHLASRGDAEAAARIEARLEHERDLYAVMRAALALVPEQPATGRYVLPENSPALAAALAGHPPDAVDRAFPGLLPRAGEGPVDAEWEAAAPPAESPAIPAQESVMNLAPRARSVPSDAAIRAHHAETPKAADLAARWGVSTACVYQHLRRLGLGRAAEAPVPALPAPAPAPEGTNVVAFTPAPHVEPASVPATVAPRAAVQWDVAFPNRLGLDDLVLAVALSQRAGLGADEAIRFVRADAAAAGRQA